MKESFCAYSRYDRGNNKAQGHYRFLTLDECKKLSGRVRALGQDGRVAEVTVTSVKTWKTRPDVAIGWKFGLYEYGKEVITNDDDNNFFVTQLEL